MLHFMCLEILLYMCLYLMLAKKLALLDMREEEEEEGEAPEGEQDEESSWDWVEKGMARPFGSIV